MPLRVAAGLVVTAVEQAKELPRKAVELPVTAVSGVMQASMRLQQVVTELAIKGDRALSVLRPVPEQPTWARFDEDEADAAMATPRVVPASDGRPADTSVNGAHDGVSPLPGYDEMTIAQLRARLRRLPVDKLSELLVWETGHQNRPPFVTMLTNRIATVSED
jgi:hypothetical protein